MKVAFFHGLDSEPITSKNQVLRESFDDVYDPQMDYYTDVDLFEKTLEYLKENPVDLLIGSSMGGYFAYCLSTHLGIPTLLFNPALHSRPIEPKVSLGEMRSNHLVILGREDDIISPDETKDFLYKCNALSVTISDENMGHSIPIGIFKEYVYPYKIFKSK